MPHENINICNFEGLVSNRPVVDFVKRLLLPNYQATTQEQQEEIETIYEKAFDLLGMCGNDRGTWTAIMNTIVYDLFRKDDPNVWFRRSYGNYWPSTKGALEYAQIMDHIKGNTILDFGCGRGYLALKCRREGYNVLTTDVVDQRIEQAQDLTFKLMRDRVIIPYRRDAADTALAFGVLHHLETTDLNKVLREIKRVCGRVIIKEDVYGIPLQHAELIQAEEGDELLQEFALLPQEDQLKVLALFDFVDNAFAQGIPGMNFPFQFKTIPEWHIVLADNGFDVVKTVIIGFKRTKDWTGTCHALFVADCDMGRGV